MMESFIANSLSDYICLIVDKSKDDIQIKIPGKDFSSENLFEALCKIISRENAVYSIKIAAQCFACMDNDIKDKIIQRFPEWIDDKGNLTAYRNEFGIIEKTEEKEALIIVGYDYVDDKSSLAHFFEVNLTNIYTKWMKKSFKKWMAVFGEEENDSCDSLLKTALKYVDLSTLGSFLEEINVEDYEDFSLAVGRNLYRLNLPCFYPQSEKTKNNISVSIKEAKDRINGTYNLDINKVKKSRDTIDKLKKNIQETEDKKSKEAKYLLEHPESYSLMYNSLDEYLEDCGKLLEANCSEEVKEKIIRTDSYALVYKVFKYKEKKEIPEKVTETRVYGLPLEAVISALWKSLFALHDEDKNAKDNDSIAVDYLCIKPNVFYHNLDTDGDASSTADIDYVMKEIVIPLLGGLDGILNDGVFSRMNNVDFMRNAEMFSALTEMDWDIRATKNIPYFTFIVEIKTSDDREFQYKFRYDYKNDSPVVYSLNLVRTVYDCCTKENSLILPTFGFKKFTELFDKTDDEVELFFSNEISIEDSLAVYDLTKSLSKGEDYLHKQIEQLYSFFLEFCRSVLENGFYYAVFNKASNFYNTYKNLFDEVVSKYSDDNYKTFRKSLARAFWLINLNTKGNYEEEYLSSSDFSSGIISILHPTMLDMFVSQIGFLLTSFTPTLKEAFENDKRENSNILSEMLSLSALSNPIPCMLKNDSKVMQTKGTGLLYLLGHPEKDESTRPASVICRYEEDIKSSVLTRSSQESMSISHMLKDYYYTYMMARFSLRINVVLASNFQPVIAGILDYISFYNKNHKEVVDGFKYSIDLIFYVDPADESNVVRWISILDDYIKSDNQDEFSKYYNLDMNFYSRIIEYENSSDIINYFDRSSFDSDITIFYQNDLLTKKDTIFNTIAKQNCTDVNVKFPLTTKSMPRKVSSYGSENGSQQRTALISNRQFSIYTSYLNYIYSLRNKLDEDCDVVVEENTKFAEWNKVLDYCVKHSERVIAIGKSIDKALVYGACGEDTTILGISSGIGASADLNYVVASGAVSYDVLKNRLAQKFIYKFYLAGENKKIVENLINASKKMSDLSLIKTISCKNLYCHDYFGYSMIRHLLKAEDDCFTDVLLSMDSYKHWFKKSSKRADLLWIRAKLNEENKDKPIFSIKLNVIESKLGDDVYSHLLAYAAVQAFETSKYLEDRFNPESTRYDVKYWWMQLHRIIASNSVITSDAKEKTVRNALENLADGFFEIEFNRCVVAFETSSIYGDAPYVVYKPVDKDLYEIVFSPKGIAKYMARPMEEDWDNFYSSCISQTTDLLVYDESTINSQKKEEENNMNRELEEETSLFVSEENEVEQEPSINPLKPVTSKPYKVPVEVSNPSVLIEPEVPYASTSPEGKEDGITTGELVFLDDSDKKPEELKTMDKMLFSPGNAKVLLGKDDYGNECYWNFGSDFKNMQNRHMLVLGGSGSGKSYAIKCILTELAKYQQASIVLDYTNGFTMSELKEDKKEGVKTLYDYVRPEFVVRKNPIPMNPLAQAVYPDDDEGDGFWAEKPFTAASRATDVICHKFILGQVQKGLLATIIENGIKKYGKAFTLESLGKILEEKTTEKGPTSKNIQGIYASLITLIKNNVFGEYSDDECIWDKILRSDGTEKVVSVFQLELIPDSVAFTAVDFILWDLYNYAVRMRMNERTPQVIVLDEFQNLSLNSQSPVRKILQEGRKKGVNLILATQALSNIKTSDGQDALTSIFNSATVLFFRPTAPETKLFAENASKLDSSKNMQQWENILSNLQKGECIAFTLDEKGKGKGRKIRITKMENR